MRPIEPSAQPAAVPAPRAPRPGFTLVEILTATAIMALVVSLIMTILTQVMGAWNQSTDALTLSSNARQALDIMAADLQTMVLRKDNNQWLFLDPNDSGLPQFPTTEANNFSRLIFFTSTLLHQTKDKAVPGQLGNPIYGDLSCIEYRVEYADPFGNPNSGLPTYSLHRVAIDPATTYFGLNGVPVMGINEVTAVTSLHQLFDSYIDNTVTPIVSTPPAGGGQQLTISVYGVQTTQSSLVDNVGQFIITLYFSGYNALSDPPQQPYPMTAPPGPATYYYYGGLGTAATVNAAGYLDTYTSFVGMAYADISLTLLTDGGVSLLQSYGGKLPEGYPGGWPQFLSSYGMTFTERVPFLSAPH
jgi:prepilin-type N-terminal cleavage/methylation domain-containing protein